MTPFIPHISDDSTSDLACGHYDPLAAMRTETEVSKSKSHRLHSGDHSCATATTATSKAPLKRDKIPLHSSINYCLFFSPRNREKVTTKALKATMSTLPGAPRDGRRSGSRSTRGISGWSQSPQHGIKVFSSDRFRRLLHDCEALQARHDR